MRVGLLQVELNSKSRAANLQALNAAIDRAGATAPAPDLLVLPGACDTGGAAPGRGSCEAVLEGVKESIAWKAREWGVFIAAGLHLASGGAIVACGTLFDPDGDVVGRSLAPASARKTEAEMPARPWASVVGAIGVVEPTLDGPLGKRIQVGEKGAVIAVPVHYSLRTAKRRMAEANLVSLRERPGTGRGLYWVVVAPAAGRYATTAGNGSASFLSGPDGVVMASASGTGETFVFANVPLEPN